jgi:ribonucleoside-diphosphate reductase alpha chain
MENNTETSLISVKGVVTQVRKRDGRLVDFDLNRIVIAISKAMSNHSEGGMSEARLVADKVYKNLIEQQLQNEMYVPVVEEIQDYVERELILSGFASSAKGYILYREKHAQIRVQRAKEALESGKFKVRTGEKLSAFKVEKLKKSISRVFGGYGKQISVKKVVDDVVSEVLMGIFDGVTADGVAQAVIFALRAKIERDPNYSKISARYLLNNHYKKVIGTNEFEAGFVKKYRDGFASYIKSAAKKDRLNKELLSFDLAALSKVLMPERDKVLEYLGAQTLIDRYFLRDHEQNILEVPQYFWMRVAMGLAIAEKPENRVKWASEFYEVLSKLMFVSSTPTLFHSGTTHSQLSSCYLTTVEDDLGHIFKSIGDNAQLSKWSGGLGNDWSNIRATGSLIKSTNVPSQGVIPFLKIADATTAAINRSGKRRGATCAYLETWHMDIESCFELSKKT